MLPALCFLGYFIRNNNQSDNSIQPLAATKTWKRCMISALKDHFGVAMTGGLWAYLEKKAYKEAAKLLV